MPEFNKDFYAARSKELLDTLTEAKGCTHSCPCTHCGKKDTRAKRCTSCKFEKYCNVDCQKADWKYGKQWAFLESIRASVDADQPRLLVWLGGRNDQSPPLRSEGMATTPRMVWAWLRRGTIA
eukprot:scaffold3952_cov191-Skeletonema_marinoi.AAC.2